MRAMRATSSGYAVRLDLARVGALRPPVASPRRPRLGLSPRAGEVAAMSTSDRRQRSPLVVQLAPEERAQVAAAAQALGLSLSGYARQTLLGQPTPRTQKAAPPADVQALARLLGQLGKVGGNLNQLARTVNQGQSVPADELGAALAEVRAAAERVRQALT